MIDFGHERAIAGSAPDSVIDPPSERWIAFGYLPTDEIWWRFDTLKGQRLLFPNKGCWQLSVKVVALLEVHYESAFADVRKRIIAAPPLTKLTLCGPLRDHRSSDHDLKEIDVTFEELSRHSIREGPPPGWI